MSPIVPLLTPDLAATIADAQQRSDTIQAAAPDEKPPLGDGVPWSSWTDYADGCEVGVPEGDETKTMVPIGHRFSDSPDADYLDHLLLVPVVVENRRSGASTTSSSPTQQCARRWPRLSRATNRQNGERTGAEPSNWAISSTIAHPKTAPIL